MHLEGGVDGLSTSPSSHSVENTETAFHFLRTGQGAHREPQRSPPSSGCIVGNSVENHLLQSWIREFYAGALLAGVIWTL